MKLNITLCTSCKDIASEPHYFNVPKYDYSPVLCETCFHKFETFIRKNRWKFDRQIIHRGGFKIYEM